MLRISLSIYRLLLTLYPRQFQRDYGDLMILAFEETFCHTQAQNSWQAWGAFWWHVFFDLFVSLYQEHKDNLMTQKIDQYELNATLGEGSVATLYRAYDPQRASQVALKVLRSDADKSLIPHIKREGA